MGEDDLPFRILGGKYLVSSLLGSGATGRVYRGTQLSLGRTVAIKVLKPAFLHHPEIGARFRFEARAMSRLNHPNIVSVIDWGEEPDGVTYLVIECVEGADLFEVAVENGPMSSFRIARIMTQVAGALAHAHERGVVHRDLKPENLRILRQEKPTKRSSYRVDEVVKICDFGTARISGSCPPGVSERGTMIGTPDYMSPEQAAAAENIGPASDLYACGVIMFFLATGRLPFVGKTAIDVALMHVSQAPPRPSTLRPTVDPELEKVILHCLAKRPSARPASARELIRLLAPFLSHSPVRTLEAVGARSQRHPTGEAQTGRSQFRRSLERSAHVRLWSRANLARASLFALALVLSLQTGARGATRVSPHRHADGASPREVVQDSSPRTNARDQP